MTAALQDVECAACGAVAYPSINMDKHCQMVPCCPSCGNAHPSAEPAQATPLTPAPMTAKVVPLRAVVPPAVSDPIQMIRSRLEWLEAELAKSAEYNAERRRLRRMLKAAGDLS